MKRMITMRLPETLIRDLDAKAYGLGLDRTALVSRLAQILLDGELGDEVLLDPEHPWWDFAVGDTESTRGTPGPIASDRLPISDLLNLRTYLRTMSVESPSGCWEMPGDASVYPPMVWGEWTTSAHRLSYAAFVEPLSAGMLVRHRCENRRCVNPHHLYVAPVVERQRDAWRKKRLGATVSSTLASAFPASIRDEDIGRDVTDVLLDLDKKGDST